MPIGLLLERSSEPRRQRIVENGMLRSISLLPRRLLIAFVRAYQLVVSPHLAPSCRYTPSCSSYSMQAFERYGAFRGAVLTAWRLARCAPWGRGGYDPPVWFGEKPAAPSDR